MYNDNLYSYIHNRMHPQPTYTNDSEKEKSIIEEIKAYNEAANTLYLQSILNPECHLAKIPSRMPIESAMAGIKYNFTITPNENGMFCLIVDPYYQKVQIYQDSTVNGQGAGVVSEFNCPQDNTLIDQYRLVSSSIILKYYGNFNQMSGIFVAGICSNVRNRNYTTFLNFDNVENLQNKQVIKCVDGVKLIYSPLDESATDFRPGDLYANGSDNNRYQYCLIVIGYSFPNTASIRVDYFRNIEYTVTPQYQEYITQTKELPSDFSVPNIDKEITPAPIDFNSGQVKNNLNWKDKVFEFAKGILSAAVPIGGSILKNTLFSNFK